MTGFQADTMYRLADPERYDDEYGTGFDHALSVSGSDGCIIADCWIVNAAGERHPGYCESPMPQNIDALVKADVVDAMRSIAKQPR